MSPIDALADKAQAASERLAGQPGIKGKLAGGLAEDAAFLRKLKPALIKKRVKGEAPTDQKPDEAPRAPSGPQLGAPPKPAKRSSGSGGPNPFLIVGAALAGGILLAKWIDWRGHAHPRW
ncbi:MAG: hypothetical protein QOF43_1879 [Gaiellaceae bacterium]|nr:hypothetical protein [Gaiellaceae bacterium]